MLGILWTSDFQFCAIAVGAVIDDSSLVRPGDGWYDNVFLSTVSEAGPLGWTLLAVVLALGAWAQRLWTDVEGRRRPAEGAI